MGSECRVASRESRYMFQLCNVHQAKHEGFFLSVNCALSCPKILSRWRAKATQVVLCFYWRIRSKCKSAFQPGQWSACIHKPSCFCHIYSTITLSLKIIMLRNTIIGALAYGSSSLTDRDKVCAEGRSTFARIRKEERDWIKTYTDGEAWDSKCNPIWW